jgi:DNA-binding transcriptional regulator PaaX
MKKKSSIQEQILRLLGSKKALRKDFIHEELSMDTKTKYAVNRSLRNLADSGLVEEHSTQQSDFYKITPEGRHKLRNIKLSSETSLVSTQWDGFWRVVILDLPETRKSERNSLRYILKKAGFQLLKNSVWVSPLPFEHMFMNIKEDLGLDEELIIMVTEHLDPKTEEKLLRMMK